MVNRGLGTAIDPVSQTLHSPAQVNFFHVGEEVRIKSPAGMKSRAAHKEAGSAGPENFMDVIVLTRVLFYCSKNSSPAERIAVPVNVSAGGSRIFKGIFVSKGENLGLAGCHIGTGIHEAYHRFDPSLRDLYVGIKQDVIIGFEATERLVIAPCITLVHRHCTHGNLREFLAQHSQGAVRGSVVGYDDLCTVRTVRCQAVLKYAGKESFQEFFTVIIQDK